MGPLQPLVWCPYVNLGGGTQLISNLVPALARDPRILRVKLAAPAGSLDPQVINPDNKLPLEFVWLEDTRFISWLRQNTNMAGMPRSHRVKTRLRHRLLNKKIVEMQTRQLHDAAQGCDLVYVFWPHRQPFITVDKPIICTFQDATFFDFPEILGAQETNQEWNNAANWLHKVAQVVVSSETTKDALLRHFGEHCRSAVVIHHAISPREYSSVNLQSSQTSPMLAQLPQKYLLCPSNTSTHKNHYMLLNAWARFERRGELSLVLIGEGTDMRWSWLGCSKQHWQQTRLAGLVNRIGLQPGRDFYGLGYVSDADAKMLLVHSTAVIMPTLAEGGGSYPIEEALTLGIPVLCSDIPVLREHLAGRTAKIGWFDPMSVDSIIHAINDLLNHYDAYKLSAERGKNDPRPTWDQVASNYVDIFFSVV